MATKDFQKRAMPMNRQWLGTCAIDSYVSKQRQIPTRPDLNFNTLLFVFSSSSTTCHRPRTSRHGRNRSHAREAPSSSELLDPLPGLYDEEAPAPRFPRTSSLTVRNVQSDCLHVEERDGRYQA